MFYLLFKCCIFAHLLFPHTFLKLNWFFAVQLQYDLGIDIIQTNVVIYVTLVVKPLMYLLVCDYYVEMCYEERYFYLCMYMKHLFGCHHWIWISSGCELPWVGYGNRTLILWQSIMWSSHAEFWRCLFHSPFFYFVVHYMENFRLHIDVSLITLTVYFCLLFLMVLCTIYYVNMLLKLTEVILSVLVNPLSTYI